MFLSSNIVATKFLCNCIQICIQSFATLNNYYYGTFTDHY